VNSARELDSIQYIRGIAACAVVVSHAARAFTIYRPAGTNVSYPLIFNNPSLNDYLAIGVDLFFVVSGFIMVHVSEQYVSGKRSPSEFLFRRIWRIFPLYWIVTIYLCLPALQSLLRAEVPSDEFSAAHIVGSLLLWPSYNSKGLVMPILGVGWTLSYEMLFYFCFYLSLKISPRSLLAPLLSLLVLAYLTGLSLPGDGAPAAFLSNPIMFEFIYGALLAQLYRTRRLGRLNGPVLLLSAVLAMILAYAFPGDSPYRVLTWGLPAALSVAAAVRLSDGFRVKLLTALGDASYSIYLVHIPVVYAISGRAQIGRFSNLLANIPTDILVAADLTVAILAGCAVHLVLERPPLRMQPLVMRWGCHRPTVGQQEKRSRKATL
jgi:exopolysaccharide production protein ExoZ